MRTSKWLAALFAVMLVVGVSACGDDDDDGGGGGGNLSGNIAIDGSSTVQPFAEAAAELFNEENPDVRMTVGGAGTGDGFEKFCRGETQISDASRPIEPDEEKACQGKGIKPAAIQVANDGIAVVTNPALEIDCMTTEELKSIFEPNSDVKSYSAARDGAPDEAVSLYTPGEESGTFDFFTDELLETDAEQRQEDVQTSADDNQLVTGVSGEENAMGYFGFSFYEQNKDKLNLVGVDSGSGCVKPSSEVIQNGTYKPLARPLYMYPSDKAIAKPEVKAFMDFVLENQQRISEAAQIVPMTEEQTTKAQDALRTAEGG